MINGSDLVCLEVGRDSQIVTNILINKALKVCCRLEQWGDVLKVLDIDSQIIVSDKQKGEPNWLPFFIFISYRCLSVTELSSVLICKQPQ